MGILDYHNCFRDPMTFKGQSLSYIDDVPDDLDRKVCIRLSFIICRTLNRKEGDAQIHTRIKRSDYSSRRLLLTIQKHSYQNNITMKLTFQTSGSL
jgi:hypothetical protein